MPDLTILLDLDPQEGLKRIQATRLKEVNRLDLETLAFHQKVHEGYDILKQKYASNLIRVFLRNVMRLMHTA